MIELSRLLELWHACFHAPVAPVTIAVFRVLLGLILIANTALLLPDLRLFFGPRGVLPLSALPRTHARSRLNLFFRVPDDLRWVGLIFAVHLVAATMLTIGLLTPLAAAVAFVTLVSIHHRNTALCHGGDNVLRLMCFLTIFSQAGAALSVDARLFSEHLGGPWAQRLMQIQVAVIYARTVAAKLRGKTWWRGTAAYYPTHVRNYARRSLPRCLDRAAFVRLATWGTLAVEAMLAFGIWVRELRYPLIVAGIGLHLVFELFMNIQLFGVIMMCCLVLFVDPADMLALLERLGLA